MIYNNEYFINSLRTKSVYYSQLPIDLKLDSNEGLSNYSYIDEIQTGHIHLSLNTIKDEYGLNDYEKMLFLEGLCLHETAHLIFSDYTVISENENIIEKTENHLIQKYQLYNSNKCKKEDFIKSIFEYIKAIMKPDILNALEDGAIENAMGYLYPKTYVSLMFTREKVSLDDIEYMKNHLKEISVIDAYKNEILLLCTYGYNKDIDEVMVKINSHQNSNEIKQHILHARLLTKNTMERNECANKILDILSPMILNQAKKCFYRIKSNNSIQKEIFRLKKIIGCQSDYIQSSNNLYKKDTINDFNNHNSDIKDIDKFPKVSVSDDRYTDFSTNYQNRIEKLKKETEKNQYDIEKNKIIQLIKGNKPIDNIKVIQIDDDFIPSKYGRKAIREKESLIISSNLLSKQFDKLLLPRKINRNKKNLDHGKNLSTNRLYRYNLDGKIFMNKIVGHQLNVNVTILLDISASMSYENRLINAMKSCYELGRVMQTLKIPFSIHAHHEKTVSGKSYVEYINIINNLKTINRKQLDKIFALDASEGTDEGKALSYTIKNIIKNKRANQKSIIFILSDAETGDKQFIRNMCDICEKIYNITIIAIGVGHESEVKKLYKNYIYIRESSSMRELLLNKFKDLII